MSGNLQSSVLYLQLGKKRLVAQSIEGCNYNTPDCRLPDTYSHPRDFPRQTTEAQSVIVTHTRGGRVPRQRPKPLEPEFPSFTANHEKDDR